MVNAGAADRRFTFQEGRPGEWYSIVDTSLPTPQDIVGPGEASEVLSANYLVSGRSVAVFVRAC